MLMREAAPGLRPGAYLVGTAPKAATLTYADLRTTVFSALKDFQTI